MRSPVSGVLVASTRSAGDAVKRGQALATVEAMKMHYTILAPIDGAIAAAPPPPAAGRGARLVVRHRAEGRCPWIRPSSPARSRACSPTEVYPAPVTPEEMARESKAAFDAGASVIHVHFRKLGPGQGHLPSWEPEVALAVVAAIRAACPGIVINQTTGTNGPDISGPVACLKALRPEVAALNAGSLNYLKTRSDGAWAWPPMLFDNPVEKIADYLATMKETGILAGVRMFRHRHRPFRPGDRAQLRLRPRAEI